MKIDCISDLHGHYPKLEGGDLLIIAGDLTKTDSREDWFFMCGKLSIWSKIYKQVIVIAGNHDNELEKHNVINSFFAQDMDKNYYEPETKNVSYLEDSEIMFVNHSLLIMEEQKIHEIRYIKIWGSPWSPWFKGVNPKCKAFMLSDNKLAKKYAKIPDDIDILITHSPPYGTLDGIPLEDGTLFHVGCKSLRNEIDSGRFKNLKYVICGHIHEQGHCSYHENGIYYYNCSHVNEHYKPIHQPISINYEI